MGWPIAAEVVEPFYGELQKLLGVDSLPFEAELLGALGRPGVDFSDAVTLRFSKWIPFAGRNLARTLGAKALENAKITVVSHANVAELVGDGVSIREARCWTMRGGSFAARRRSLWWRRERLRAQG